jgi:hypothetical protein
MAGVKAVRDVQSSIPRGAGPRRAGSADWLLHHFQGGMTVIAEHIQGREWSQIVARAWADPAFKNRLLSDPHTVLREHGMELPPGARVQIHENSDEDLHFILPASPSGELSEEELSPAMGADSWCGACRRCHRCGRCGCGCYKP